MEWKMQPIWNQILIFRRLAVALYNKFKYQSEANLCGVPLFPRELKILGDKRKPSGGTNNKRKEKTTDENCLCGISFLLNDGWIIIQKSI